MATAASAAAASSAHTAAASSSAARPAAAGAASNRTCSSLSLIQFLAARSIGLHSTHLRLPPRRSSSLRPKRKAITADLESDEAAPTTAQPTLLPVGSFPAGFFLRPPRPEQLQAIWARPPLHQRFRLQALFDTQRYPRIREHVFLAFDRSGTMLISYTKAEPNAASNSASEEQDRWADHRSTAAASSTAHSTAATESGYTLSFWLFAPPAPLRLISSVPLFRSLACEGSRPPSAGDYLRAHLGMDLGNGEDEHHYIQMQESTDSRCFVLTAAKGDPTEEPRAGLAEQSSKVHVSIVPSPLQLDYASTPQIHFSFVSSIRIPSVELVTIADPFSVHPAQQCLIVDGVDTVQCMQFGMEAASQARSAALSTPPSPPPILDDPADHMLGRTSSLLSAAITRTEWISDLAIADAQGSLIPNPPPSLLLPPWTLECEVFVRDLCVGVSRRLCDYGLAAVRCEGFRTSSSQSRTMLLVVETESSAQTTHKHMDRTRFEALLLVWNLERLHDVERVPLHWTGDYMQRLLRAHKIACAARSLSDAERISQAGAHELAKSLVRPLPVSMRRVSVNNFPLFSKRSRQLILNPALPIALLL